MFRKPRNDISTLEDPIIPSVGRPPTPPLATASPSSRHVEPTTTMASIRTNTAGKSPMAIGNGPSKSFGKIGKPKQRSNGNILSFFRKVNPEEAKEDEGLFVEEKPGARNDASFSDGYSSSSGNAVQINQSPDRFNEDKTPQKRIRTSSNDGEPRGSATTANGQEAYKGLSKANERSGTVESAIQMAVGIEPDLQKGPFAEDSDSDEEPSRIEPKDDGGGDDNAPGCGGDVVMNHGNEFIPTRPSETVEPPPLCRQSTSFPEDEEFGLVDDFAEDEFPEEGEENIERRWMEEQRKLELDFEQDDPSIYDDTITNGTVSTSNEQVNGSEPSCPICNAGLSGISDEQASRHVNGCLDGDLVPLPTTNDAEVEDTKTSLPHKRFQRAAIPRPAQANPISLNSSLGSSSAFSKLMSTHAEDEAWATAAANEVAARGKPAFKRTCPFYKILPGLYICVDAFRYGAVEECNAYFLSHFHSDHYIGLTSSWCHGPIYCSHVTANLVRQQLRVDPRWVVDLEFEEKTEVPGTQGVHVTMIPANHCPGSSLFLFEKTMGKGNNPRIHRVLHCGDFRACPAHVEHPLLRPDVVDVATGKNRQQKLDVCYLDTTYLTPKYAFPSQEAVIKACADMCVSLSKDKVDESDDWEKMKRNRAGSGMVKFVRKDSSEKATGSENPPSTETKGKGSRGRLLVIVGTYSIGKERICLGVARALNSKIFAPPGKQKVCRALEDPELNARLTSDPLEAQVHMQMLMEIRAETLADYLTEYRPHFSRIVGFRPSGWNYRPPNSRFTESPLVQTVLRSDNWRSTYSMAELVPQRGSTREASCFGVPYSEHSSFRELTMFCCALRIDKIIPTVNVGSAKSREKMKGWIEKWSQEKKKNGLFKITDGQTW